MEAEGIKTNRFRADSASYQKEVIDLVTEKDMLFYIRATRCASMKQQIGVLPDEAWNKIRLGVEEMEVAEINNYQPFGEKKSYRLVISRIKLKISEQVLFTGTAYTYRAIITNDVEWNSKQIKQKR